MPLKSVSLHSLLVFLSEFTVAEGFPRNADGLDLFRDHASLKTVSGL